MDTKLLQRIKDMVLEVNSTNKTNDKKIILAKYEDLQKILLYVYDDNKVFSITSKNYLKFEKNKKKIKKNIIIKHNLFSLLDDLIIRKITGDTALLHLYHYINRNIEYKEYILNIVDKSLKIRLNTSVINKIFPGLIQVFQPVLANKYDPKRLEKSENDWYISRKLDGVRCLILIEPVEKSIKFLSRKGKEFHTLNKLKEEILKNIKSFKESIVLDGEIVSMENGVEDFTGIMKEIKKKNHTMINPKYFAFDILKKKDFFDLKSEEIYSERLEKLKKINLNNFEILEQKKYTDDDFSQLIKESEKNNWEGLMLREDINYEGKRTNSLLKYKKMHDEEYKVLDIIKGPWREISKETKLENTIETMVAVIIDYNNTKVGSGFSLEERKNFYKNPDSIIGKIITVQYFEKTKDSLRFPVFKYLHGNKRIT
jgi:DNA ligase-1